MLLFTDIDRTLLARDYSIHHRVRRGFRQAEAYGLQIIFVTARAPHSLRLIAEELGILGYCACYNGAWVGSLSDGTTLTQTRLPIGTALGIMEQARETGVEPVWYDDSGPQVLAFTPAVLKQLHNVGEQPRLFDAKSVNAGPHKIMCIDRREDPQLARVAGQWSREAEVAQSHNILLEIGPKHVSKGTAVKAIAAHLGRPLATCSAAGDSYNDIPMLEIVGTPLAVDNAVPEVKAIAMYVAPSCDEGGLRDIIDYIIARL